jgi:N-succinyl-L-ornithine transcarbamylase
MKQFTSVNDVPDLKTLIALARAGKANPELHASFGEDKAVCLLFLNPSLRTRLSTQRAAAHLGLTCMVMDVGRDGWQLEFSDGVVMNGNKAEHVREAAQVVSQYCDVIGLRTFSALKDRDEDYSEPVLSAFVKYASVPVLSLESAIRHPLQSLTDLITIEEHVKVAKPKIVLSWAPHPRALPQAVANSFAEWTRAAGHEITIACPQGFELSDVFSNGHIVTHDQDAALAGADVVYTKNWSSYNDYGAIGEGLDDWQITAEKMARTNEAKFMHCLPVRRNVVVSDAVIDSANSLVFAQADNRTWAAKAVLQMLLHD